MCNNPEFRNKFSNKQLLQSSTHHCKLCRITCRACNALMYVEYVPDLDQAGDQKGWKNLETVEI